MKKINRIFIALTLLTICFGVVSLDAQKNEGAFTMEITDITSDDPQVAAFADMLKGGKTKVFFKGKKSLTNMEMMGGMVKVNVKVDEEETSDMLMEMMGQKIWVNTPKAEADRMRAEQDSPMSEMEIEYDETDTKTVAGYECYKMTVTFPDAGEGTSLSAYITEDITVRPPVIQGVELDEFKGFPLEYVFNNPQMSMTMTTTSFEDTVDEGVFELNTSGYQKMTMSEFMDMMGSMGGGGGFGF